MAMPSYTDGIFVGVEPMFTSSKYSDLTIHCRFDTYLVHRAILCPRSKYFATTCDQNFDKDSHAVIVLDEDDPATVNRMLIFLYTNDYPEGVIPFHQRPSTISKSSPPRHLRTGASSSSKRSDSPPAEDTLMNNLLVNAIADKYGMTHLKELSWERIHELMQHPTVLKDSADLSEVIRIVFSSAPVFDQAIKDIIIQLCADHLPEILTNPMITEAVMDLGLLSFGIMIKTREKDAQELEKAVARAAALQEELARNSAALEKSFDRESTVRIEKEAAIESQKQLRIDRQEAINEKNKAIESKLQATKDKIQAFTHRDLAISQKTQTMKERDTAIWEKDNAISDEKEAISQKNIAISEKVRVIRERDAALLEKHHAIRDKNNALSRESIASSQKQKFLAERDAAQSSLNQYTTRLDYFLSQSRDHWQSCRHCLESFENDCYVQRFNGNNGSLNLQLRCCFCETRHDLGAGLG